VYGDLSPIIALKSLHQASSEISRNSRGAAFSLGFRLTELLDYIKQEGGCKPEQEPPVQGFHRSHELPMGF